MTAPGDGEVTVVTDETIGEKDPLLARLLAAATAGAPVMSEKPSPGFWHEFAKMRSLNLHA